MKTAVVRHCSRSCFPLKNILVLSFLFLFVLSACSMSTQLPATPTLTSTSFPAPIIVLSGPCELSPGETIPLSVTGISGAEVVYRWSASAGNISPSNGPVVTYKGPDIPQNVIIRVEAEKNGVSSDATITCKVVGPTAAPVNTETPTPTLTPTPSPTQWACTSYRDEKLQDADVPGTVTIDTLTQGTTDLPTKTSIQVAGTYSGIPEGKYLWVFIYSADAGLHGRYYPQTVNALENWQPEPTTSSNGRWSIDVGFGAPNLCYEVIVLVADAEASKSIADQLKAWADLDNYAGYELNGPETAIPPDPPGFPDGLVEKASIEVKTR